MPHMPSIVFASRFISLSSTTLVCNYHVESSCAAKSAVAIRETRCTFALPHTESHRRTHRRTHVRLFVGCLFVCFLFFFSRSARCFAFPRRFGFYLAGAIIRNGISYRLSVDRTFVLWGGGRERERAGPIVYIVASCIFSRAFNSTLCAQQHKFFSARVSIFPLRSLANIFARNSRGFCGEPGKSAETIIEKRSPIALEKW